MVTVVTIYGNIGDYGDSGDNGNIGDYGDSGSVCVRRIFKALFSLQLLYVVTCEHTFCYPRSLS